MTFVYKLSIALITTLGVSANAGDLLWCRGKATVAGLNGMTNIALTFDASTHQLSVYDISDDTEPWIPLKVVENKSVGDRDHIRAVIDGAHYPINVDPTGYEVSYEVDQVLGFPDKVYNFTGMIGGLKVPKTDLDCAF